MFGFLKIIIFESKCSSGIMKDNIEKSPITGERFLVSIPQFGNYRIEVLFFDLEEGYVYIDCIDRPCLSRFISVQQYWAFRAAFIVYFSDLPDSGKETLSVFLASPKTNNV